MPRMLTDQPPVAAGAAGEHPERRAARRGKVVLVMPAYNAADTLRQTWSDIPTGYVDEHILVDDASRDDTVALRARSVSTCSSTRRTRATAATRNRAIAKPSRAAPSS
jgi:glycosyltransferase involved in cell wall biosynthesis